MIGGKRTDGPPDGKRLKPIEQHPPHKRSYKCAAYFKKDYARFLKLCRAHTFVDEEDECISKFDFTDRMTIAPEGKHFKMVF